MKIAEVDFDEALYLGSSEDGVYFDAEQGGEYRGIACRVLVVDEKHNWPQTMMEIGYTTKRGEKRVRMVNARSVKKFGWYLSADVDCNTGGFVDTLVVDDGPYETRNAAMQGGLNAAYEWLVTNEVRGWRTDYRRLAKRYK